MKLGPSPFCWLEFDAGGSVVDAGAVPAIAAMLAAPGITDLVVISHGWRNNKTEAKGLYKTLWENTAAALAQRDPAKISIVGILWPSKPFAEDFDVEALEAAATQGALSAQLGTGARKLSQAKLDKVVKDFNATFGASSPRTKAAIAAARKIVADNALTSQNAKALVDAAKALLSAPSDSETSVDTRPVLKSQDAGLLLATLMQPRKQPLAPGAGQAQGLIGDFLGNLIQGAAAGVGRFLNLLTYFEMKERSGVVGRKLATDVLPRLGLGTVRLHLIGHSFGARLVSSAVNSAPAAITIETLTLLQGAFSHNAYRAQFQGQPGAFPRVIGRPLGPLCVTHTFNDKAVTLAYALASRLANQVAAGIGDASDPFGAMGANGPQGMTNGTFVPVVTTQNFAPARGMVNTFFADAYIADHNDITNPVVGRLVAATIEA